MYIYYIICGNEKRALRPICIDACSRLPARTFYRQIVIAATAGWQFPFHHFPVTCQNCRRILRHMAVLLDNPHHGTERRSISRGS